MAEIEKNNADPPKIDSTENVSPRSIFYNEETAAKPLKRRKTRWGNRDKSSIIGMPTTLPSNLTYVRLEEINNKLRLGTYIPPVDKRSPSPEPIYGNNGKLINTVEYRYRKKLEDERNRLIEEALKENPNFMPPADFTKDAKLSDKVYIPQAEFPEVNFIGLLIGPRGNTLKKMEAETGAKISIRGKGSVKDGKRMDLASIPAADEDLHCLVTADSEFKSASLPEGQNDLKREQLKELALLNGTFIDEDLLNYCTNCGAMTHKKSECPEALNYTVNMICKICNGAGHNEIDCVMRNNPEAMQQAYQREQQYNDEYKKLMSELGENATFGVNQSVFAKKTEPIIESAPWSNNTLSNISTVTPGNIPPWARRQDVENDDDGYENDEGVKDEINGNRQISRRTKRTARNNPD